MPRKTTEREHKLSAIDGALKLARKLTRSSRYGGLKETDDSLQRAQEALQWLRDYPESLVEPLAALEHDQFHAWCQIYLSQFNEETRDKLMPGMQSYVFVPECFKVSARTWAKAATEVFKTGAADLRRRETRKWTGTSKISDGDVVRMRRRRADGGTLKELAKSFNVSQSNVSLICSGKRRKEAGGPLT